MPSSSLLIWPVQRALVCRWTVLVAGVLSLAVVGVRPGARNWFARAFSVDEDNFSASRSPFRKSTLREYSFSSSGAGLLLELKDNNIKTKTYQLFIVFYFPNEIPKKTPHGFSKKQK